MQIVAPSVTLPSPFSQLGGTACGLREGFSCIILTNMLMSITMNEWMIEYYSDKVQQEILSLPAGIQARYIQYTRRMLVFGPNLGMPHSRAMGDGLFELRLKAQEGIGRVFYCTLIGSKIVMLHTFVKKTQKTPAIEIETARRRMAEVKARKV